MEVEGSFEDVRKLKLLNDLSNQGSWKDREVAVRELAQDTAFVKMHIDLFALMLDDEAGLVRAAAVTAMHYESTIMIGIHVSDRPRPGHTRSLT